MPEPENFLYKLFHSQSRNNFTRYRNNQADRVLDQARAEQVYLKRIELYRQAEKSIMEDAPLIPINYHSYERLFQRYVQSIEVSALGDQYSHAKDLAGEMTAEGRSPSARPRWLDWVGRLSFRVKLALLVNLLIILLILGTAFLVERRQRFAIIQEVEKRALVMAQALESAVAADLITYNYVSVVIRPLLLPWTERIVPAGSRFWPSNFVV